MIKLLFSFYQNRFLSRFLVLLIDVLATCLSLVIAITFRFGFNLDAAHNIINFQTLIVVLLFYLISFLSLGSYKDAIPPIADAKSTFFISSTEVCLITFSLSGDIFFQYHQCRIVFANLNLKGNHLILVPTLN